MKVIALFLMMAVLVFSSCVPRFVIRGSYIKLKKITAETILEDPSQVLVFYKKQPDFEFTEIGIVEGIVIGQEVGLVELFTELQKQAIAAGGTAIHKIEIQRHNQAGNALHATAVVLIRKY